MTQALMHVQQQLHGTLRQLMVTVRTGGVEVWLVLAVLGLFYGVIHSLLPGHRKMVLFSYFLSQDAPIHHGIAAGVALGVLHALTAVVVVAVGYYLLQLSVAATVGQVGGALSRITALFVVLLGGALLYRQLRELLHKRRHEAHEAHGGRGFLAALIVSGIVPCPGATMVLLLAATLAVLPAGLVVVASMSVGMALTLSTLAVLTIVFKSKMAVLLQSERGHRLHFVIETAAAAFIAIFGVVLLALPPL